MDYELTDITLVVDRSGSMVSMRSEAQNGINQFIKEQKKAVGKANLTLVQFDTEYEFVHRGKDIQKVGKYKLMPRGMTALLDAMGRAIEETGSRLRDMPKDKRPGTVVFVVVTDGCENSSREYTKETIKQMVEHQRNVYNWQFLFLGADLDTFADALSYGFTWDTVAIYDAAQVGTAYTLTSSKIAETRSLAYYNGEAGAIAYTNEDREQLKDNTGTTLDK